MFEDFGGTSKLTDKVLTFTPHTSWRCVSFVFWKFYSYSGPLKRYKSTVSPTKWEFQTGSVRVTRGKLRASTVVTSALDPQFSASESVEPFTHEDYTRPTNV